MPSSSLETTNSFTLDEIRNAERKLSPEDFYPSGQPKIRKLSEALGRPITAKEYNHAVYEKEEAKEEVTLCPLDIALRTKRPCL